MGPINRDHSFNFNKKKKTSFKSALSTKLAEKKILFIDTFKLKIIKQKIYIKI